MVSVDKEHRVSMDKQPDLMVFNALLVQCASCMVSTLISFFSSGAGLGRGAGHALLFKADSASGSGIAWGGMVIMCA